MADGDVKLWQVYPQRKLINYERVVIATQMITEFEEPK